MELIRKMKHLNRDFSIIYIMSEYDNKNQAWTYKPGDYKAIVFINEESDKSGSMLFDITVYISDPIILKVNQRIIQHLDSIIISKLYDYYKQPMPKTTINQLNNSVSEVNSLPSNKKILSDFSKDLAKLGAYFVTDQDNVYIYHDGKLVDIFNLANINNDISLKREIIINIILNKN